jgi:hypothetical protein
MTAPINPLQAGSSTARPIDLPGFSPRMYVTGGRQRSLSVTDEWRQYGTAVIVGVDPVSGVTETCVEYISPPDVCPDTGESSIQFKAGTMHEGHLYVCTSTEVLVFAVPAFTIERYISLPCFNDLHHVRPTRRGTLLVANTGLDMVVEISRDGAPIREWNVLGRDPWAAFSREVDYRKVETTKPHKSHPNHVFGLDGEIWVTRFQQRDAICLTNGARGRPRGDRGRQDAPDRGRDRPARSR